MNGRERILHALRQGPVNSMDFINPSDGGKPIHRVAGRILELKQAGFGIDPKRMPNGTATYTLVSEPAEAAAAAVAVHDGSLAGPSSPPAVPSLLTGEQLFDLAVPEKPRNYDQDKAA